MVMWAAPIKRSALIPPLTVATEGIDRLHTTAEAHQRVIVVEIMGHNAGWLTLGAGIAGGADVILIPEIPYKISSVVDAILDRSRRGKRFSIVAVAEGARTVEEAAAGEAEGATDDEDAHGLGAQSQYPPGPAVADPHRP